jgi:hypothetical protein
MDEWELLNTEDGLALQEFLLQELYELHKRENLPHNADKTVSARFTEESLRFKND